LPSFHVAHMERAAAARSPCFFAAIADMVVSRWVCDDNGCFCTSTCGQQKNTYK
jgi:hypothetical protein